jgi:hypothetical protein
MGMNGFLILKQFKNQNQWFFINPNIYQYCYLNLQNIAKWLYGVTMHNTKVICKVKQTQQWNPMFAQFIVIIPKEKQMNLLSITTKGILVH